MAKSNSRAASEKTKTAVVLSPLAIKRLGAACVAESLNQSQVIEWLINDRLKDYSVTQPPEANRIPKVNGGKRRRVSASAMVDESASGADHMNSLPIHAV